MTAEYYDEPYSAAVRDLFAATAHAGVLPAAVTVSHRDQGVALQLAAISAAGRLQTLRYRVSGCPHTIAVCEAACAGLEGGPSSALATVTLSEFMQSLAVPVEKSGRILVIEDTLRQLGAALANSSDSDE